jgi:Tfp pilus assembly protein PilF
VSSNDSQHPRRFSRGRSGIALAAIVVATAATWWAVARAPAPHAPVAAPAPATAAAPRPRNADPAVAYVGDAACARCHKEVAASFRQHPMGRSMHASDEPDLDAPAEDAGAPPFQAFGLTYRQERRGARMLQRETRRLGGGAGVLERSIEVDWVVGSGTRARSYLFARGDRLFQSPISWYAKERAFALSPGYGEGHLHFERPVNGECMFCHSNRAAPVPDTLNRYRQPMFEGHAIGCERCHGPGRLHVEAQRQAGDTAGPDATIVDPSRLEPALREAVCEQCHLQGRRRVLRRGRAPFDYRPGLPLHDFWSVFTAPPGASDDDFVGHVEQMHDSRCYRRSDGRLGCMSCHDPHRKPPPEERVAFFRERCLQCHADRGCGLAATERLRRQPDDDCASCHLPRRPTTNIQHTSITDHRVPRFADRRAGSPAAPAITAPLVHFHHDLPGVDAGEVERDLGIALASREEDRRARAIGELALPKLEAALARWPDDLAALDARAHALWLQGRHDEALATFQAALAIAPAREITLVDAATLATAIGPRALAIELWQRAIAADPLQSLYHGELAALLAQEQRWELAATHAAKSLELEPFAFARRQLLTACWLRTGRTELAQREFDRLVGLRPDQQAELERWFAALPR